MRRGRVLGGIGLASLALSLVACGDCGGPTGDDAASAADAAHGDTASSTDSAGHDQSQPPTDAAVHDTTLPPTDAAGHDGTLPPTDAAGHDTMQAPTDAAGHDQAQPPIDAGSCPTQLCYGTCCEADQTCDAHLGACCHADCTGRVCGSNGCSGSCGNCQNGQQCSAAGQCETATTPTNDACGGAIELSFDSAGLASAMGDTTGATDDSSSLACYTSGSGGKDVVYSFALDATYDLTVRLLPAAGANTRVYLQKVCGSTTQTDELGCGEDFMGIPPRFNVARATAGTYYVWVDSITATAGGPYLLQIQRLSPPANDSCDGTPTVIDLGSGSASVQGSFAHAGNDYAGTCGYPPSVDLVYQFTLTQAHKLTIEMSAQNQSSSLRSVFYVRSACASDDAGDQLGCTYAQGSYQSALMVFNRLDAGTYYLIVEPYQTPDDFVLDLTTDTPLFVPDECSEALPLTFDGSGKAQVQGDLSLVGNDTVPVGCGGSSSGAGADAVYGFHLDATSNVEVTLSGIYSGGVLYVRDVCDSTEAAHELGCCQVGDLAQIDLTRIAAGDYWVWVDTQDGGSGTYGLQVTALTPPTNDACDQPEVLTFNSNMATAIGDTSGAAGDYTGSCGGSFGRDLVYQFELQERKQVTATVTAISTNFVANVYLRSTCASDTVEDQLGCKGGSPANLTTTLPAGTYFLVVDDSGWPHGQFNLSLTLADPPQPPANNTCAGAIPLESDVSKDGSTIDATSDYGNTALSALCDAVTLPGRDVVYVITPASDGMLFVALTPNTAGYLPTLWATSSCGDENACESQGPWYGLDASVTANTPIYIIVDGTTAATAGEFTITATLY
ncbi:MAG: hypothetical protein ABIJ09_26925 [Pseudomonadota bacterium]